MDSIKKNVFTIFILHFLLVLIIQIENALFFYEVSWWQLLGGQFQNLLISGALAGIYYSLRRSKLYINIFLSIFLLILVLISMNQIFFQIFHENFSFSFTGGVKVTDIYNYWGSFAGELEAFHFINLVWITFSAVIVFKCPWVSSSALKLRVKEYSAFSILLIISFFIQFIGPHSEANTHLAFSLFRGVQLKPGEAVSFNKVPKEQLYKLKYGRPSGENNTELSKVREVLKNKKNVIFIVLESVGSMQIFKQGKIDSKSFPILSRNEDQTLSIPMVHNNFPGTTRSHIPIITGGETLTWGSVFKELLYSYTGPTISSEFKKNGFKTALVSAMGLDFENLSSFYNNLGFDYLYDSDKEDKETRKSNSIHTWGIDEKIALKRIDTWLEQVKEDPFYLQFLTNTTHHPYGAPENFSHGVKGNERHDNYRKSLIYTDHMISKLVELLKAKKKLNDTVIFISGDHGEAFGKIHKNVFAHKSYLYEETIKNFLLIYTPETSLPMNSLDRRASLADILPTITENKGIVKPLALNGQNLLSDSYQERVAFFHKNTSPELWGLRDGKWKFITEKVGGGKSMLFDLDADPTEQKNLIADHPEREHEYRELVANWFIQTNDSFVKNLKDYVYLSNKGLSLNEVNSFGPKRITVGSMPNGLQFSPLESIHPEEKLTVWTHGVAYPKKQKLTYKFKSPSGKKHQFNFTHKPSWTSVYAHDKPKRPREQGQWEVAVFEGRRELVRTKFMVSKKAKLIWSSVNKKPGIRKLYFGIKRKKQKFQPLEAINPKENFAVFTLVKRYKRSKSLEYVWTSPSGKQKTTKFKLKKGWTSAWVYFKATEPLESGIWSLEIRRKGKKLISGNFLIDPKAALHEPLNL